MQSWIFRSHYSLEYRMVRECNLYFFGILWWIESKKNGILKTYFFCHIVYTIDLKPLNGIYIQYMFKEICFPIKSIKIPKTKSNEKNYA